MKQIILFVSLLIASGSIHAQDISKLKWKALGPMEVPPGVADTGQYTANGIGWIESLEIAGKKEKRLYAGSNVGGLFVSRNRGMTWKFRFNIDRVCGVWDIVVDEKKPKRLWVATGSNTWDYNWGHGVLYSKNAGKTWQNTGLSFEPYQKKMVYALERSSLDPELFVACTETDIYRSDDATKTWTLLLDQDDKARISFRHLVLHNQNKAKMIASGAKLLFSEDGGVTWTAKDHLMSFQKERNKRDSLPSRFAITVNPQNNDQVMVVYTYKRLSYLERSNDFGKTWYTVLRSREFDRVDLNHAEIVWHPTDSNVIVVGSVRLYMSTDRGNTFDLVSEPKFGSHMFMHDDIRAMSISKKGNFWVGSDGGVSRSTDTCKTWSDMSGYGLQASQFYDIAVDNGRLVGGCQDLSSMMYFDGEWHHTSNIYGDGGMNIIKGNEVYVMQNGMRIRKGSFANDKWDVFYTPFAPNRFKYPFVISPRDSSKIWGTDHDLWEMGTNRQWENLTKEVPHAETKIVALDVSDPAAQVVYFAKDQPTWIASPEGLINRFYKGIRTETGYDWRDITSNLPILAWREITSIASNPYNIDEVYVSLYGFDDGNDRHRVYKSLDGGETWINYSSGLPNLNANKFLLYKGYHQFLATDEGVFYRNNDELSWAKLTKGLPNCYIMDLEVDESLNRLFGASFGNGVWYLDLPKKWNESD